MVNNSSKILSSLVKDVQKSFADNRTILSFEEYFRSIVEDPRRYLRSSAQYMVDMFDYYGVEELDLSTGSVLRFKLFDAPFTGGEGRVSGHEAVQ